MLAIIGGSGLDSLGDDFVPKELMTPGTPYGETSGDIYLGEWHGVDLAFLPRHGPEHNLPPHQVNYRANLWALHQSECTHVIAVNAVGGISAGMPPQTLVVPDQIIDYSSGRETTFFDAESAEVRHIDFSFPYSAILRGSVIEGASHANQAIVPSGTYGCTNGPRLETAIEIRRMRRDGCDMVGMTGMPEAALARELEIDYVCLALVVNRAAGIDRKPINMDEIRRNMSQGIEKVKAVLLATAEIFNQ